MTVQGLMEYIGGVRSKLLEIPMVMEVDCVELGMTRMTEFLIDLKSVTGVELGYQEFTYRGIRIKQCGSGDYAVIVRWITRPVIK